MIVVKRDNNMRDEKNDIENLLSELRKRDKNKPNHRTSQATILSKQSRLLSRTNEETLPSKTTCRTTVGDLHTKPLEQLLTTTNDQLYHIRINLEQEYYPKYTHMWI